MNTTFHKTVSRGFTFIELLVTAAIMLLIFGGLMSGIQYTIKLITNTKVSTSALALATEQIEYIRSLQYDDVGTVAGIPSGSIPQNSTTTLNGYLFHERVLVQYVDSADDGIGGADANGILADYKEVKVEYSWSTQSGTSSIFLLTNVIPPGIETTVGGGTLAVNVFDADVLPVAGAEVHVYNDTTTSTIDTIRYTNVSGSAMFSGAPEGANYQITVTKPQYSTDQTYTATTSNPNPTTQHVAVLESTVSTMNFQIDELSDLLVRTVEPKTTDMFTDTFDDMTKVAASTSTETTGGALVLMGGAGAYVSSGSALSTTVTPAVLLNWDEVTWSGLTPVNTTLLVRVYAVSGGVYTLIPDGVLSGNSAGFTTNVIDLSPLNVATYPSLALEVQFTSTDVNATPALQEWSMAYVETEPEIPGIPFVLTGNKVIGTTVALAPIYKYSTTHTTDGSGEIQINDLEWDVYDIALSTGAYNIKEACPNIPYALEPGVSDTVKVTLVPSVTRSMRVMVENAAGDPIESADVELSRGGFSDAAVSSECGQVFFNTGVPNATDFQIDVEATGFVDQTISNITIDDAEYVVVTMVSS